MVDGIPVLSPTCLIPFKAKAWLDLKERKLNGEQVDSKNIKKHKNDVFRLAQLITANTRQLGLQTKDILSVVNFKCDPIMIGSFLNKEGYFPAYHMNKTSWITVALDGSVPDDEIRMLLDMSFEATASKIRKKKKEEF